MKYRALFLDFYGTLVSEVDTAIEGICSRVSGVSEESRRRFWERWSRAFAETCLNSYGETFRTQREIEVATLSATMAELSLSGDPVKESEELYDYWMRPAAFPESSDFLSACPVPICIVSNIDTDDFLAAAETNGWTFENVITSESARSYKPRTEMFTAALALMELEPSSVLHVGDSLSSDIRGAAAAGIDTAWINRKEGKLPEAHVSPTFEFSNLSELLKFLKESS